jgi:hypothetical protein
MYKLKISSFFSIFIALAIISGIASWVHGSCCDCEDSSPPVPGPEPSDSRVIQATEWTTNSGGDLDTYYGNQHTGGGCTPAQDNSVDFIITIDQVLSIPNVFLILSTWDVDYTNTTACSTGHPEVDRVYINGNFALTALLLITIISYS